MNRKNPRDPHRYDDMLNMSRPISALHPPMSRRDRAAQFAPFAALTGLGAAINETARQTERRIELGENALEELNDKLRALEEHLGERPEVTVTFFRPDEKKTGGAYVTAAGILRRIDRFQQKLCLEDGTEILFKQILALDMDSVGTEHP